MSYILDALRRADSERERGAVPSLNAQPEPLLPEDEAAPPRAGRWTWLAAALGVIVVLGGALAWSLTRPQASPAAPAGVAPAVRSGQAPAGVPNATPAGMGLGAGVSPASAPSLPPLPPEAYAPPPVAPKPIARAASEAGLAPTAGEATAAAPARSPGTAGARRAAASAPGDARGVEAPRIYAQHELPEEVRRGIPALVVNGSVYSKNVADRFLIINGQIVHENGVVAPDVVLEQIRQRAAVLNSKGFRFEITY